MRQPHQPSAHREQRFPHFPLLTIGAAIAVWIADLCTGPFRRLFRPLGGVTVEDIRADLRWELPPGSSRQQVEDWVRTQGAEEPWSVIPADGPEQGLRVRVPNDSRIDSAFILLHFSFDSHERLDAWHIERRRTGFRTGRGRFLL